MISETLAPPPDKTIDCDVITLMATPTGTTEVYDGSKVTCLIFVDMDDTFSQVVINVEAHCTALLIQVDVGRP